MTDVFSGLGSVRETATATGVDSILDGHLGREECQSYAPEGNYFSGSPALALLLVAGALHRSD